MRGFHLIWYNPCLRKFINKVAKVLVNDLLWPLLQTELFLGLVAPGNCCHAYITIDTLSRHSIVGPNAIKLNFNAMFFQVNVLNRMIELDDFQSDFHYKPNSRFHMFKYITAPWALSLCPIMCIIRLRVWAYLCVLPYLQPVLHQMCQREIADEEDF